MNVKHCKGCHDDVYNNGLGGSNRCWGLDSAKRVKRKEVSIHQVPPWKQKACSFPSCYNKPGYVYVEPDRNN